MKENDKPQKMDPVVHFEFPGRDTKRMCSFYTKAFGWQTQQLGDENGNYVLVTAAESDEAGHPKEKGRINGGFYPRDDKMPGQYPSVVIAVDDIQQSMKKIRDAGGEVLG